MQMRNTHQLKLFDELVSMPNGFVYYPEFLTPEEEKELVRNLENIKMKPAIFQEYTAKRKIKAFGYTYNFAKKKIVPGPELPPFLLPLKRKIAKWLNIPASRVVHALVTKYEPGTAIGWHRDTEEFEHVVGISLSGWCEMRFRPLGETSSIQGTIRQELEPRSAYIMQKDIRWKWQHHIPPTKTLRYSLTFRTLPK